MGISFSRGPMTLSFRGVISFKKSEFCLITMSFFIHHEIIESYLIYWSFITFTISKYMNEYVQVVFMLHCSNPAKALQSKDFLSFASLLMSVSGVRFGWPPTNKAPQVPKFKNCFCQFGLNITTWGGFPRSFDWMIIKTMVGDLPTSLQRTSTWDFCFFVRQNAKVVVTNRRYWKFSWDRLCAYYVCMCVCVYVWKTMRKSEEFDRSNEKNSLFFTGST